jgi:hypothetical protein
MQVTATPNATAYTMHNINSRNRQMPFRKMLAIRAAGMHKIAPCPAKMGGNKNKTKKRRPWQASLGGPSVNG